MPRKHRATSVDGQVIAMQAAMSPTLPPPWPLDRKHRPVWDEIMQRRARSEWHAIDLRFAHQLCNTLVALRDEERLLAREGSMVATEKGMKPNPRNTVVGQLRREAISLSRYLRVHPSSDGRTAEKFFHGRREEAEARETLANGGDGAGFLATVLPKH